ncbi:hypothetical protein [Ornithinibacillus scapharcae]|uniref:hypothetical protein n=1 Tax=Ornithinibacillus scapharcae TaxID=1147159 RepID=UPI000225B268|nr:hypothetical protein [Ornithinibacillus scapharcae]
MNKNKEIDKKELNDFISGDSFQRTLRKSRRKQLFLYIIISILTTCGVIFFTQVIGHHIINNKIEQEVKKYINALLVMVKVRALLIII